MRYLLDTVALLMWLVDPDRLGRNARAVIATRNAPVHLSAVNVWEIANKNRIGKLPQVSGFEKDVSRSRAGKRVHHAGGRRSTRDAGGIFAWRAS